MENYILQIKNIELEYNDATKSNNFTLNFNDYSNNNLASFELDINQLHTISTKPFVLFRKLTLQDKKNILNNFIDELTLKKTPVYLNFQISNGEKSIKINKNIMSFIICDIGFTCKFNVVITEQLIEEFQKMKIQ